MSNPAMEAKVRELMELKRMKAEIEDAITEAENAIKAVMGSEETLIAGILLLLRNKPRLQHFLCQIILHVRHCAAKSAESQKYFFIPKGRIQHVAFQIPAQIAARTAVFIKQTQHFSCAFVLYAPYYSKGVFFISIANLLHSICVQQKIPRRFSAGDFHYFCSL